LKNVLERPVALLALLVLSPVMALIAVAIKVTSRGPVFHRRRVIGQYGTQFDAFKFRTMVVDADRILNEDKGLQQAFLVNHKLAADPRVTPLGRVLRKYSLDELPQLLNIVRGEMWLIGPRMISPPELERYGEHAPKLMSVKPGLTGLWQVSGRQTTSYARRVELDMQYIDNWHPAVDARILVRTFAEIFRARGAY
jgi:lipopolysaccharide/colanic/teichoic acid biosynthesis glycosyltransferase